MATDGGAVADDDELAAGAGEGDVHAPGVGEEANFAFGVGADEGNDDRFFFAALKAIDGVDFEAVDRELLAEQANLRGVRGDDGNLAWRYARIEQRLHFFSNDFGFSRVAAAFAVRFELFVIAGAGRVDKRERRAGQRAGRYARDVLQQMRFDAVVGNKRGVVELFGREVHDGFVHAVLCGEKP